eukprot:7097934-Pyramimonas_sp.AAC.1
MIRERLAFVNAQRGAGLAEEILLQSQATAIASAISTNSDITVAVATSVTEVIAAGPWSDHQKAMLASVLADAAAAASGPQPATQPRKQQKCPRLPWFFLQKDWEQLVSAELSVSAKITLVANRMWLLGMLCPSEGLQKQGVAIVICCDPTLAEVSGTEKRRLAKQLKDTIQN